MTIQNQLPRLTGAALGFALAACGGSTPPPGGSPAPQPNIDPVRLEPAADAVVRYATEGTLHYALHRRDTTEAQMPSGEVQTQAFGHTAYLTVQFEGPGNQPPPHPVRILLDSIALDPDANLPLVVLDSAAGVVWTGQMRANGTLAELTADRPSSVADLVRSQVQQLFPPLPPNGVQAGAQWTDSLDTTMRLTGFDAQALTEAVSSAGSVVQDSGRRVLPITTIRTAAVKGEGTQFGQAMKVEGTAHDTATTRLGLDGRMLESVGSGQSDFTITVESVGQAVPVKQRSRYRVTLLP